MNPVALFSPFRSWCAASSLLLLATAATATPPVATTTAAGRPSGTVLARPHNGSAVITITYEAQDADGNLTGIRPQVWHQATDYFQNNNGQWISTDGTKATYELQVPLDRDGDWFFWTDAIDADGNFVNSLCWADAYKIVVEQSPSTPPKATVDLVGLAYSQQILRPKGSAVTVTARFRAFDGDGNLTGIRPQMYHPATNHFWNNSGSFYPQSGIAGELSIPLTLDRSGEWLIWADAIDANGNFANSGAWGDAFVVRVAEDNGPDDDAVAVDANGDHIPDEVIKCGTGKFTMTFGSYYNDCYDYWWYDPSSDFFLFDSSFWTGDYRWSFNDIWLPSVYFWSSCDLYVEPLLVYEAEAGYDYAIYRDVSGTVGVNPADWVLESSGAPGGGTQYHSLGFYSADMVDYGQFYLVRYGSPIVGAMFTSANGVPIGIAPSGSTPTRISIPHLGQVILKAIDSVGKIVLNPTQAIWRVMQGQTVVRTATGEGLDLTSLLAGAYVIYLQLDDQTSVPIPLIIDHSNGTESMWETNNPVNRVVNHSVPRKDDPFKVAGVKHNWLPPNRLYTVGTETTDGRYRFYVSIALATGGNPTEFLAAPYLPSRLAGPYKKAPAGPDARFGSDSICNIVIEDQQSGLLTADYIIKYGHDDNANGVLDDTEAIDLMIYNNLGLAVGPATVHGISHFDYNEAAIRVDLIVAFGRIDYKLLPDAPKFLRIFRDGSAQQLPTSYAPDSEQNVDFNCFSGELAEWLTHHSGAQFAGNGNATFKEYRWTAFGGSGKHPVFTLLEAPQTVNALRAYYDRVIRPGVTAPGWFPISGWADVYGEYPQVQSEVAPDINAPGKTVEYDGPMLNAFDNVNGTFGRLRLISHQARFEVANVWVEDGIDPFGVPYGHNELRLVRAHSKGEAIDLYDFNYESGLFAKAAATLQIGFAKGGTGRTAGQIYRTRFVFDTPHGGF